MSADLDLSSMTVVALTALAKERGVRGYSGKRKADLIAMLSSDAPAAPAPAPKAPRAKTEKTEKVKATKKVKLVMVYGSDEDADTLRKIHKEMKSVFELVDMVYVRDKVPSRRGGYVLVELIDGEYEISVPNKKDTMVYSDDDVRYDLAEEDKTNEDMVIDQVREILLCMKSEYF